MNRRNFLKILACSTAMSSVGNTLFAKTVISEEDDYYTVDSLNKLRENKPKDVF